MKKEEEKRLFLFEYKDSTVEGELLWESHCHARYEMIAVIEGDITVIFEGKPYRLKGGQCAVISPLSYHIINANRQGRYRRVTALFDTEAIPAPLRSSFFEGKKEIYILSFPQGEALAEICESEDAALYAPLAESIMVQLLYAIYKMGRTAPTAQVDETLAKMLSFVDAHLCEPIRLSEIAASAALSVSSVSHIFREKMKISPKQYILRKKLALASKLIGEGTSPTDAALFVGYEDYSNFYRMYRKQFEKKPTEL